MRDRNFGDKFKSRFFPPASGKGKKKKKSDSRGELAKARRQRIDESGEKGGGKKKKKRFPSPSTCLPPSGHRMLQKGGEKKRYLPLGGWGGKEEKKAIEALVPIDFGLAKLGKKKRREVSFADFPCPNT